MSQPDVKFIVYVPNEKQTQFQHIAHRSRIQFHIPARQNSERSTRVYIESDLDEETRLVLAECGLNAQRNTRMAWPTGAAG